MSLFEHHHDHGHDHDVSPAELREVYDTLDPAQQSMSDALRVSFLLLKAAMAVVFVIYLCSGFFNVRQGEKAIVLRFGQQTGDGQVYEAGGPHFAFPYPIDQIERVEVNERQLTLFKSFWFKLKEEGAELDALQGNPGPLDPEKDGSLITGDANIVHARWAVRYRIDDVSKYLASRPEPGPAHAGKDRAAAIKAATEDLVRTAAEQGVVETMAQVTADDFMKGDSREGLALKLAQRALDRSEVGIRLTALTLVKSTYPLSVLSSVTEVNAAQSAKAKAIEEAQAQWAQTLGQTAGDAYRELLDLIDRYELAFVEENPQKIAEAEAQLDAAFETLEIATPRGPRRIEGDVASHIEESRAFRTNVVESLRGEAEAFAGGEKTRGALERYRENPEVFLDRRWQDAVESMFSHRLTEYMWLQGQPYIELNRKESVRKDREAESDKQQKQASGG